MNRQDYIKISMNVPRTDYETYKKNIRSIGKIPTYDFIAYIKRVNREFEGKEAQGHDIPGITGDSE